MHVPLRGCEQIPTTAGLTWLAYLSFATTSAVRNGPGIELTGPGGWSGTWRLAAVSHPYAVPYGWSRAALAAAAAGFEAVLDFQRHVVPVGACRRAERSV